MKCGVTTRYRSRQTRSSIETMKDVERVWVTGRRCPACHNLVEDDVGLPVHDGLCGCYRCTEESACESWIPARVRRRAVRCPQCSTRVSLTPSNVDVIGIGHICPRCYENVSVLYGRGFVDPGTVLDPSWNGSSLIRGQPISDGLWFIPCRSKKDFVILKTLQDLAKKDDSRFLFFSKSSGGHAALLVDLKKHEYVGYLTWNITKKKKVVVHQLFVVRKRRREGAASAMLKWVVDRYASNVDDTFGIEAPNDKTLSVLVKMGYAVRENDGIRCLKCRFVPSM